MTQDKHYSRTTRYRKACRNETKEDYFVKTFLIGDSLAFDFGEVAAVRDYFRRKGLVKVHTP